VSRSSVGERGRLADRSAGLETNRPEAAVQTSATMGTGMMTKDQYLKRCAKLRAQYPDCFVLENGPVDFAPGWLAILEKFFQDTRALFEGTDIEEFRQLPVRFRDARVHAGRVQFSLYVDTTRKDIFFGPRKHQGPTWAVFRQFGELCRVAEERCSTTCQFCGDAGTAVAEEPIRIACQRHRDFSVADLLTRFDRSTAP
jgi:hypothetical protein